MPEVTITEEDGWFVISDEERGVTTEGKAKLEALLMLVDALASHEDINEDPLSVALDVFVPILILNSSMRNSEMGSTNRWM